MRLGAVREPAQFPQAVAKARHPGKRLLRPLSRLSEVGGGDYFVEVVQRDFRDFTGTGVRVAV